MEQTERSETLALKLQTLVNHPEESIQHSEDGENLKSRIVLVLKKCNALSVKPRVHTPKVPGCLGD
jgi:hypothetical protein